MASGSFRRRYAAAEKESASVSAATARPESAPVGIYQDQDELETTLSLPSVIGRKGVREVLPLPLDENEAKALQVSADEIKTALADPEVVKILNGLQ